MNCRQFDQRIQQRLDSRADLALDVVLQRHARDCRSCAYTLTLYECLANAPEINGERPVRIRDRRPPQKMLFGSSVTRALAFMAAAVCIILLPRPVNQSPNPSLTRLPINPERVDLTAPQVVKTTDLGIGSFVKAVDVRFWITDGSPVDLTNMSQINLRSMEVPSLMPQGPVNAVLLLPSTLESIEPIYWYTSDLPGLSSFKSGINYALTLIRDTLPTWAQSGPSQKVHDLGKQTPTDTTHPLA